MQHALKRIWHTGREYLTHWMVAGAILAATGAAPEHWLADLFRDVHVPEEALHLWAADIDMRMVLAGLGLVLIVGDIAWRRTRPVAAVEPARVAEPAPMAEPAPAASAVPPDSGLALPDKPSIAVLPFDNLSGDPEQEYFSDGVAEDVITQLSRSSALFVIARNSSFTYKGRAVDVKQVGRELGVRYVLEGSVRRAGERVRISAQLVEAETGNHIWAERYDRPLADVFAVQDEISDAVTTAIGPAVADAEMQRAMRRPPASLGAWDLYQQGRGIAQSWVRRRTMKHAVCSNVPLNSIRCLPPPTSGCHSPVSGRALNTRPCRWTRQHGWQQCTPSRRLNSIPAMRTRKPCWPEPGSCRVTRIMPWRSRGRHLPSIPTVPMPTGSSEQS